MFRCGLGRWRGYIGIMEKIMETSKGYLGDIGIMEEEMETTDG